MKLTFVEALPEVKKDRHDLQGLIKEFMDSERDFAKIEIHENDYPSLDHAYNSMWIAIRRSKRLVKAVKCSDGLYLVRIK